MSVIKILNESSLGEIVVGSAGTLSTITSKQHMQIELATFSHTIGLITFNKLDHYNYVAMGDGTLAEFQIYVEFGQDILTNYLCSTKEAKVLFDKLTIYLSKQINYDDTRNFERSVKTSLISAISKFHIKNKIR